jgi:hypothetical protein
MTVASRSGSLRKIGWVKNPFLKLAFLTLAGDYLGPSSV